MIYISTLIIFAVIIISMYIPTEDEKKKNS